MRGLVPTRPVVGPSELVKSYGHPGIRATVISARLRAQATAGAAVAAGILAGALKLVLDDALHGATACLVIAGGLGWACNQWRKTAKRYAIGGKSERVVAGAIRRADPVAVVHGALLGAGGDADHVVLGPAVAVVETKTGFGKVLEVDGGLQAGRRRIPKDPVAQVERQAHALGRLLGIEASSVVCVTKMVNRPFHTFSGCFVCSADSLPEVLAGLPHILDDRGAMKAAKKIRMEHAKRSAAQKRRR